MIKFIFVGKIKEKYLQEATNDYLKRLSKYTKINTIEIEDINPKLPNALEIESEKILKNISNKDFVVTLEINGEQISSEKLAKNFNDWVSNFDVVFVIGSSNGLHDNVLKRSNYQLSFSKLTFPHQLFRLIFLEQIYRSFKIINNESYHK